MNRPQMRQNGDTMKRLLAAICAVALLFAFVGCGDKKTSTSSTTTSSTTTTKAYEAMSINGVNIAEYEIVCDEEGNEYNFEVLDRLDTDTGSYLALLPVYDDPQKMLDDSGELVIVKEEEDNGEFFYSEIEDDDEYETVADAFSDRLSDFYDVEDQ